MTIVRSDGKKNIRREKKVQISNGRCIRRGQVHLLTMNVPLQFQWILDCRYCLMPYPVKNARKKTGRLSLSMKKMFYNWTIAFVSNKRKVLHLNRNLSKPLFFGMVRKETMTKSRSFSLPCSVAEPGFSD
jgi:hypothetical protein